MAGPWTNTEIVSFNERATDNRGEQSPVKFEATASSMGGVSRIGSANASQSGVAVMMRELDQIQSEVATITRKIEQEKKRREQLDAALLEYREQLKYYRDVTKSGRIVKDDDMISKKMISKLEYQVAQARNKLSSTHKENKALRLAVGEARQEKLFKVSIYNELKKEIAANKLLLVERRDEINVVNNKKQRKEVDISNMKQKMFVDVDNFAEELLEAKSKVLDTQASILEGIRARLQSTFNPLEPKVRRSRTPGTGESVVDTAAAERQSRLVELLREVKVNSLEELIVTLQKTEEEMFQQYNEIQSLTTETEKAEVDNKHLEQRLEDELSNLAKLEESSDHVRVELEEKISAIHENMAHYDASYGANLETLSNVKIPLQGIFQMMSLDEDPTDQAFIATGITDRNTPEYLGQVEQRIDELIQMMKASKHERLSREDFVRTSADQSTAAGGRRASMDHQATANTGGVTRIHNLPSLHDADDDDDYPDPESKVLPVNVGQLKGIMAKKMSNGMKGGAAAGSASPGGGATGGYAPHSPVGPRSSINRGYGESKSSGDNATDGAATGSASRRLSTGVPVSPISTHQPEFLSASPRSAGSAGDDRIRTTSASGEKKRVHIQDNKTPRDMDTGTGTDVRGGSESMGFSPGAGGGGGDSAKSSEVRAGERLSPR